MTSARKHRYQAQYASAICGVVLLSACDRTREHGTLTVLTVDAGRAPVPTDDHGSICDEVGDLRVCWEGAGEPAHVTLAPRPTIAAPTPLGWRCAGSGAARTCVDRSREASAFVCEGARCAQQHPRLPGDGEWTCADAAGAALCVGGGVSAGVIAASVESGFSCAPRPARRRDSEGGQVCIDLAPDTPDGKLAGWRCGYMHEHGPVRVCERDSSAHNLADPCSREAPCVDGARCVASRCIPAARPTSLCWLDADCAHGPCRLGACQEPAP